MQNQLLDKEKIMEALDKGLLELIGFNDIPDEKKEEIYKIGAKTVQNRAIARIYQTLSEQDAENLDNLAQSGTNQEIQAFLANHNLDLGQLILEETLSYKMEIAQLFKDASRVSDGNKKE